MDSSFQRIYFKIMEIPVISWEFRQIYTKNYYLTMVNFFILFAHFSTTHIFSRGRVALLYPLIEI